MSPADWLPSGHLEGLPTLFIDRSLGRIRVPALLREAGLELVTLAEHYGIPQDETVADVTWLADTAARGWVALGKDERIRRRPAEKALLADAPLPGVLVWAPCSGTVAMSVSVFSYAGKVTVGFLADANLVPAPPAAGGRVQLAFLVRGCGRAPMAMQQGGRLSS